VGQLEPGAVIFLVPRGTHVASSVDLCGFPGCREGKLELDEVADARSGESDTILYLRHSVSMWSLVSMSHWLHGHAVVSWGEYLALYSPIGA